MGQEYEVVDTLDRLPENLAYIKNVVLKYARVKRNDKIPWQESIDRLSAEQIGEITAVYNKMELQQAAAPLSAWIKSISPGLRRNWEKWYDFSMPARRADEVLPPEPEQEPSAYRLFELFDYLGERRIIPFSSDQVKYSPPASFPNWENVPPPLKYLIPLAKRYGMRRSLYDTNSIMAGLSDAEIQSLKEVRDATRRPTEQDEINKFMRLMGEDHLEASYFFYLMLLISDAFD